MKNVSPVIEAKDRAARNHEPGETVPFMDQISGFDRRAHQVLTKLFKYRDIAKIENGHETLYLRRFFIFKGLGLKIFLHNIRRSDSDRYLHDHPWDFTSLCLSGGYVETIGSGEGRSTLTKRWFSPFQIVANKAEHTHIVTLFHDAFARIPYKSTWTILSVGKARRVWGFWVDGTWVDWRTYLGLAPETPDSPEDV